MDVALEKTRLNLECTIDILNTDTDLLKKHCFVIGSYNSFSQVYTVSVINTKTQLKYGIQNVHFRCSDNFENYKRQFAKNVFVICMIQHA
jgi:hypothetical protein